MSHQKIVVFAKLQYFLAALIKLSTVLHFGQLVTGLHRNGLKLSWIGIPPFHSTVHPELCLRDSCRDFILPSPQQK